MTGPAHDLLVLLGDLGRLIRVEADRRARVHGLTRAQWAILSRIQVSPGLSQRELAVLLEVEPITVGRLVDRLERRGLAERRPDRQDRRIWRLYLRPDADAVLALLGTQREAILAILSEGVTAGELEQVNGVLATMKTNMVVMRRSPPLRRTVLLAEQA